MSDCKKLWMLLGKIPCGKVTTYKILAQKLGSHPRAVGRMLNSNPHLITVPCHRVVCSNGNVGGYKLGAKKKIGLLRKEGIKIAGGKTDLRNCLFSF